MPDPSLRILQINTRDNRGGAAKVAWDLHCAFRESGLDARMVVRWKSSDDSDIFAIENGEARGLLSRLLLRYESEIRASGSPSPATTWMRRALRLAGDPDHSWGVFRGLENFSYPGTWRLLDLPGFSPSIIHCHNLHSGYFDLRALPWLSRVAPVVLTLHDAWLLSGHCAHSFGCDRWKTGCGACPDLSIPPALAKDGTAANWRRKRRIFERSNLYVVAPCQWMMDRVAQSMLAPAIRGARIVPNGVDLDCFCPRDKHDARLALNIPLSAKVLSFVAEGARGNPFKDWRTQAAALDLLAARGSGRDLIFLAVGEEGATHRIGPVEVRYTSYTANPQQLALYYQASDVYAHSARAETFPLVVIEAMACGTPVVATRVGGIPEIVRHKKTGLLVDPGDAGQLANAIDVLLTNPETAAEFGASGSEEVRNRFGLKQNVATYLDFYREAQADFMRRSPALVKTRRSQAFVSLSR
jgi:glycosyltransferase involved in cell wall biosynthesis